jgi:putative glycosyltransferase (TIGR04348 family)
MIGDLGYRTAILETWAGEPCDGLIALHAVKSRPSVVAFRETHPLGPVAVALTGTDLYGDVRAVRTTLDTLTLTNGVILLTPAMADRLPSDVRARATVIVQSAEAPRNPPGRPNHRFDVCVVGHLRDVKDPLLAARAVRLLPPESRCRVTLYGGAYDEAWARRAGLEMATNPRFRWLGDRPHGETLRAIARSHVLVLTSKAEGGPAVISEALACGTPILATRIDAAVGLLTNDYPGLFPVGDDRELARLLVRFETDKAYRKELMTWCRRLRKSVSPARERRTWDAFLRTWLPITPYSASPSPAGR